MDDVAEDSSVVRVPLEVRTDAGHGGRWTSLRGGGREWLWHRDEPRRERVGAGDEFADAGGLEECIPTVRGVPDHGDAWSRSWTAADETGHEYVVRCAEFELTRRIEVHEGAVVADYRIVAEPGYRFVWAGHALLDVSEQAALRLGEDTRTRLFPEAAPCVPGPWPQGAPWIEGDWPEPHGLRLGELGPDDGTGIGAVAYRATPPGTAPAASASALVLDGPDLLRMDLEAEGQPASVALWRNLAGFPQPAPYRSIGVEPMLGRVFDLADAREDGDCAVVPANGEAHWRMTITAYRRKEGTDTHGSSRPAA